MEELRTYAFHQSSNGRSSFLNSFTQKILNRLLGFRDFAELDAEGAKGKRKRKRESVRRSFPYEDSVGILPLGLEGKPKGNSK